MSTCKDTQKFRTSEASTKAAMRTQGAIDKFLNIVDLGLFRKLNGKWSRDAKERFNVQQMLFSEKDGGKVAVPNKEAFKAIDNAKGIYYQTETAAQSVADSQTIANVKKLLDKMGVSIQDIATYAKEAGLNITGINGVADLTRGIIALADGKEAAAITEEMVHIATAIIEKRNPGMITEMISKIDRFKIYNETLKQYRDNPNYQLPNGKPDIRKIKKEAVDKLISELIVNGGNPSESFPELAEEVERSTIQMWWNKILDWFRGQYKDSNISIFQEAKEQILEGELGTVQEAGLEGTYYQLSDKQQKVINNLKSTGLVKTESEESTDPVLMDTEEATSFYEKPDANGVLTRVKNRVTDLVKNYYNSIPAFRNKTFTPEEQKFNDLKRRLGIKGHKDFELIHARYYNEDGTRRTTALPRPEKFDNLSEQMYMLLEQYYVDLANSLPEGTIILSEVKVYDPKADRAGTIDFLAIEPSGKTHILDWKFMQINGEDVAWFKKGAYDVQLGEYKRILRDQYGISEFGMTRAIPISMDFQYETKGDKSSPLVLKSIAIGSVDKSKSVPLYLQPVPESSESTGFAELDTLVSKLTALLNDLTNAKSKTEEEREFKIESLNTLRKAIRLLQITQDMQPLIHAIEVMRQEGEQIADDYKMIYDKMPAKSTDVDNASLSDFANKMNDYIKNSDMFANIGDQIGHLIYTEDMDALATTKEEKELVENRKNTLKNLEEESKRIRMSKIDIIESAKKFNDKFVGQRNNITGILKPEAVVKGLVSWFRGVSELSSASLNALYSLYSKGVNEANANALVSVDKIMDIRTRLLARGGNLRDIVRQIYQSDDKGGLVNKLIRKYSKDFYSEVDENAKKDTGKKDWLKNNIDIEAYKQAASKRLEEDIARVKAGKYPKGQEKEIIEDLILKKQRFYDIEREDFNGWKNPLLKKFPQEKWLSEEYKKISKDKDLFELYNLIVEFNEQKARPSGYLSNQAAATFLPFIRKSMAEQISFDFNLSALLNFSDNLKARVGEAGYQNVSEIDGQVQHAVPKYYTTDFSKTDTGVNDYSDVSEDLFANMILYVKQVEKYIQMTEIEGQVNLMKTLEEMKDHLDTSKWGGVILKNGKTQEIRGNSENAKLFDDFRRALLYEEKYPLTDTDVNFNIKNNVKKLVNGMTGRETFKIDENESGISMMKTIDAVNRGFQLKTLGLEIIPGVVNWFGTNVQLSAQSGNYFKGREILKNQAKLIGQEFESADEEEMFVQLVNAFMPFKDDPITELYKKAGMTTLTRGNLGDMLMFFMRYPEQALEKTVFMTMLDNSMIVDGNIVNIREYVKAKYEGKRFNSSTSYRSTKEEIDKEIEELKKTKSISATKKLEDGKLVIPGFNLSNREEVLRLTDLTRRISRNATGGMSDGDINRARMNIWTSSMLIFKNWIPKLADTRFSEFRKVGDDFSVRIDDAGEVSGQKYDVGRIRLLAEILMDSITSRQMNIINILNVNEDGIVYLDQLYERYQKEYEARTGEKLNMTPDQFKDMIINNVRNQMKEIAMLVSLSAAMIALGYMGPDDDDDRAAKNAFRYAQRVMDKFVSELSFFYNPFEIEKLLSGNMFPAIGLITDVQKFMSHFYSETTGYDFSDTTDTPQEVRERAKPIKYLAKLFPGSKAWLTYTAMISPEFAKEYDITIQAESNR